jgi:Transposase DDE domain
LDEAFSSLNGTTTRAVTKSALSQARKKLKASAFQALNQRLLDLLMALLPEPRWRGLRLVATDSTTLRLPPWLENQAEFGVQLDSSGQPYVLARALGLFATRSRLMLHAVLDRFDQAERTLLLPLLWHLESTDLLIMDRGFPAVWLFALLQQRGIPFLARMDGTQWPDVEAFARSGQTELILHRLVTAQVRKQAVAAGAELYIDTLSIRLIRVVLPNGRVEILATSLTDTVAFPATEFAELYHQRWGIEEAFKVLKHRLLLEQFSGELPESIRQDFYAKVFTANLAEALSRTAYDSLPEAKAAHYRPNLTYILQTLRTRLFCWLIQRCSADEILTLIELYANTLERKRPDRSCPRPQHRLNPKPRRQYK